MNPTFALPIDVERDVEPWRGQGVTVLAPLIPFKGFIRTNQQQESVVHYQLERNRLLSLALPHDNPWASSSNAETLAFSVGQVIMGIAHQKPFGDVEGFYRDAINHGLDWSTALFNIAAPADEDAQRPHSLLSWAVQCQNLRAVKSLTSKKGLSITSPVNALARSLAFEDGHDKISQRLADVSTADDLNHPNNWVRQYNHFKKTVARYPVVLLAIEHCQWEIVDALFKAGSETDVGMETTNPNHRNVPLMAKFQSKLDAGDARGLALYRKTLATHETKVLGETMDNVVLAARPRSRL